MNGNEKPDFLDEMINAAPAVAASEADDPPEPIETVEPPKVEPAPQDPPKAAEATTAPESTGTMVPIAGLMDERKKRQELEKKLAELQAQPKEPAPKANFYDDPERYVSSAIDQVRAEASERVYVALEAAERDAHPDFDEVTAEVVEAAKADPLLGSTIAKQVQSAANPAREMYKQGMRLRELRDLQDPEKLKAKLRDELKAELLAELGQRGAQAQAEAEARAAKAAAIPPDISNRANATVKNPVPAANPVDSLFPKSK